MNEIILSFTYTTHNIIYKLNFQGDNGGPLVYDGKTIGITSIMTLGADYPCENSYYDSFTSVVEYLHWIEERTQITP